MTRLFQRISPNRLQIRLKAISKAIGVFQAFELSGNTLSQVGIAMASGIDQTLGI